MRITQAGNPDGPPVVLLHGLGSSPRCWARTTPALSDRHRLILVDLFAGKPGPFSLESAACDLAAAMSSNAARCAAVVGHSMGGLVALHLAAGAPQLVSRLVLVDVPAIRLPRRRLAQVGAVARSSVRLEATAVGLVVASLLHTSPMLLAAATRQTLAADLGELVLRVRVPTLLVWGADDLIVPVEVGHRLADRMPDARLHVIPAAGHQPMWEAPRAFHAAVASFLSGPPPDGSG